MSGPLVAKAPADRAASGKTEEKEVTVVFPKESLGTLFCILDTSGSHKEDHPIADAKGTVPVPADAILRLHVTYQGAEHLSDLEAVKAPKLLSIDLRNVDNLNDKLIAPLQKLKNLEQVLIDNTDVGNEGLSYLAGLTKMQDLSMPSTLVTGAGLVHIAPMTALKRLSIGHLKLDDASLTNLIHLSQVCSLKIDSSGISDAGLKSIGKMQSLNELNISRNKRITDHGMSYLTTLRHLKSLVVFDTSVTTKSLPYFQQMPALNKLTVGSEGFDEKSLDLLKKGLPKCTVSVDRSRIPAQIFEPIH